MDHGSPGPGKQGLAALRDGDLVSAAVKVPGKGGILVADAVPGSGDGNVIFHAEIALGPFVPFRDPGIQKPQVRFGG